MAAACLCSALHRRLASWNTNKRIEAWPGNNSFYFDGLIVTGPNPKMLIFTVAAVTVPCISALAFLSSPLAICVILLLYLLDISALLATGMIDPGVIPRHVSSHKAILFDEYGFIKKRPQKQSIIVSGRPVLLRYCQTCNIYQPPRCYHCGDCDNCVENFDHHCPWIGTCVGKRNYGYFCKFLYTTIVLSVFLASVSASQIASKITEKRVARTPELSSSKAFAKAAPELGGALFVLIYLGLGMWFIVALCGFHVYLGVLGVTTYEKIKAEFKAYGNPYHRGVWRNFWRILCAPLPPSAVASFLDEDRDGGDDRQHSSGSSSGSSSKSSSNSIGYSSHGAGARATRRQPANSTDAVELARTSAPIGYGGGLEEYLASRIDVTTIGAAGTTV